MTGKKLLQRTFEVNSKLLHCLCIISYEFFENKILLRSIAKSVSHMACFDRFLFLRVWPSLRFPFLKTAVTKEQKLSGSKRNSWELTHAVSYCRRLLMCHKFSVNVNFTGMTVQVNFWGGNIQIWCSSLHFITPFISRILIIYNIGNPDLWNIILATLPCPYEVFKVYY